MFSRYAVCAVAIILELLIIASVVAGASVVSYLFISVNLVIYALSLVSIINRDTNPEFKLTWLAVVAMLPVVGGALYIIFSKRRLTRREAKLLSGIARGLLNNKDSSGDTEASVESLNELSGLSELAS